MEAQTPYALDAPQLATIQKGRMPAMSSGRRGNQLMQNTLLALIMALGLASCTSPTSPSSIATLPVSTSTATAAPTSTVTPEPTQTHDPAGVKGEIVSFMVDYIVTNEIEPMIDIINKEHSPMIENPPKQFMIVLSPISQPIGNDYSKLMNALDTANAEKVWIYQDGKLTTADDAQKAITEYRRDFIESAPKAQGIFAWSYDEFGIVSISENDMDAEVYLADSCGSVCGHGIVLTIQKQPGGHWEIKDIKGIWGS